MEMKRTLGFFPVSGRGRHPGSDRTRPLIAADLINSRREVFFMDSLPGVNSVIIQACLVEIYLFKSLYAMFEY